MIGVVDYGAGNTRSVLRTLERAGLEEAALVADPDRLLACDRLILPGVGAAGAAMTGLRARGLVEPILEFVGQRARPMLGICVGMQILADRLHEFGTHEGLGIVAGDVHAIRELVTDPRVHVPHMGWNRIETTRADGVLPEDDRRKEFYFAHSFALCPADPKVVTATVDHGIPLCAAVSTGTIAGVQFHPEKSQINGERLLIAFAEWTP